MCKPASFVVTKNKVCWSTKSDSHEEIIAEHKLHADGVQGPNIVRVEIVPPGDDFRLPLDQWIFKTDQYILPQWYDATDVESRARVALVD